MKSKFVLLVLSVNLLSCEFKKRELTAQEIIDQSIRLSGVNKLLNATLSFNFRDNRYVAIRNSGTFVLKRIAVTNNHQIEDQLSNLGFQRFIDGISTVVPDSMATRYSESVNAVHYFSVIPLSLNDRAVRKKLLASSRIKDEEYYKVQITFFQDRGGADFKDIFIYWIHKKSFKIDYLAYKYHTNGGGMRFREVKSEQLVQGVRFMDYNNYKPSNKNTKLTNLDKVFEKNELIQVSKIHLEKINLTFN